MSQNQSVIFEFQKDGATPLSLEEILQDLQFLKERLDFIPLNLENLRINGGALYQGTHYVGDLRGGFLPVAGKFTELQKALSFLPYNRGVYF